MGIAARELSLYVIRPTLLYMGQDNPDAEALLLGIAASQSHLGSALHDRRGHGNLRALGKLDERRNEQRMVLHQTQHGTFSLID